MAILSTSRFLLIVAILLLEYTPVHAEAPEDQVQAAILANFALFVEWPGAVFPTAGSPFVACVIGKDPFGSFLDYELGERVGGHPVEIRSPSRQLTLHGNATWCSSAAPNSRG